MTAPFDDDLEEYPPLILRWTDDRWELFDTVAGLTISTHRTLLLGEAAQIAEAWRRSGDQP